MAHRPRARRCAAPDGPLQPSHLSTTPLASAAGKRLFNGIGLAIMVGRDIVMERTDLADIVQEFTTGAGEEEEVAPGPDDLHESESESESEPESDDI